MQKLDVFFWVRRNWKTRIELQVRESESATEARMDKIEKHINCLH